MAEEEVLMEVEAVQAMYGDDCVVLDSFPPHLHVHVKPRTADVSSEQFVEATIGIRAGSQYPMEPPTINIIESKGLDEERKKLLRSCMQDKARELSSYLMLVSLCEEAVEKLSVMNHPDGDCPLCLYPLIPDDERNKNLPFMKLMSCFHCFHRECIIRWWRWLQKEKENSIGRSSGENIHAARDRGSQKDMHDMMGESMGNCPVCRKVFHAKDFMHVLDLVGSHSTEVDFGGTEEDEGEKFLKSDSEVIRRDKFEAILKLQQENKGLIEPKKDIVVQPGMFLLQPVPSRAVPALAKETTEKQQRLSSETNSSGSSSRPFTNECRSSGQRKHRGRNPRNPVKQWVRKDT